MLLNLSHDGLTLPVDDESFAPTLIGVMRGLAVLAAARNFEGKRVDLDMLGRALGQEFADSARAIEFDYFELVRSRPITN